MRISSNQMFQLGLKNITDAQSQLSRTQTEISSGKKVLTAADNPIAAVRSVELESAIGKADQYIENGNYAKTRLSAEENSISSALTSLQRVHELALQANNATQSNETRGILATEIRAQLDNMLQLANTKDGEGHYIFAGYQHDSQPFTFASGNLSYNGDDGHRLLALGPSRTIADADPGSRVFAGIGQGNGVFETASAASNTGSGVVDSGSVLDQSAWNGQSHRIRFTAADSYEVVDASNAVLSTGSYRSGEAISFAGVSVTINGAPASGDEFSAAPATRNDVFSMLNDLASSLETPRTSGSERAAQTNAINSSLSNIGNAIDHLVGIQTDIGARLNVIDQQEDINSGSKLQLQETLSGLVDVDIVEAASRFNQTLISLQASQQAFARVQQLSLFNYL
ncbi:MAG: flagellar hook-associated protein 3 FlgL [Paracoccaceae bacterium]|jgi:flagellar hook-associated protein 3 FlgL